MKAPRWSAITESAYEWEREALELIREHLPDHEPWRAWSNFEFVDDQGRVNEVDLVVLGPRGLILVEIKSRPGTVEGDGHSWVWTTDGRKRTEDNPLLLANRKAKRLASLIRRQDALAKGKIRPPFVTEAVFLSKVRPPLKLDTRLRERVFLRGRPGHEEDDGIVRALMGGLDDAFPDRTSIDSIGARAIARAIEQAGIRPSLRERRTLGLSDFDTAAYGRLPNGHAMRRVCDAHLRSIPLDAVRPGDVLLMAWRRYPQHLAIVVDHPAGLGVVHGYEAAGCVVEHRLDEAWRTRIRAAYAFPGAI